MSFGVRRRRAVVSCSCALLVLIAAIAHAAPARAGQIVFPSGVGIWVMNDDGSGQRELIDAANVPGMEYLGDPSIEPGGTEVAFVGQWNQASNQQNGYVPAAPGFCGGNCEGIYEFSGGTATRITNAPFACGAQPCESEEVDPRVASDGSVAYAFATHVSQLGSGSWIPITGQSGLFSRDSAGTNQLHFVTACEGSGPGGSVTDANVLAVNPTNSGQIIYGNCREVDTTDPGCPGTFLGYTTAFDVYSSGPSASTASDDVLMHSIVDPNAKCLQDAGTQIGDLDYSPDGSHIAELHGGSGAGIYVYPATAGGGASATELTAIPTNWTFYSVRYIGANRIGFVAGTSTSNMHIYAISTACTPATCDVSTGQGVTNLTGSTVVSGNYILGSANFGWTSSTQTITGYSAGGNGGGNGGNGGSQGSGSTGQAPTVKLGALATARRSALLRNGLVVKLTCSAACHLTATLSLGRIVLGSARTALTRTRPARLTIRLGKSAKKALMHVRGKTFKLRLTLVVSDGHGHSRKVKQTVEVKR